MKNVFLIYRLIVFRVYKMLGLIKNKNRLLHFIDVKFIIPYFLSHVNAVLFLFIIQYCCKKTAIMGVINTNVNFFLAKNIAYIKLKNILFQPKDIIAAISFVISLCNLPASFKYMAVSFNSSRAII